MRFEAFSFGSVCIDGVTYQHDVVIDQGKVRKRKKRPSRQFREAFGHTPLSVREDIPWNCSQLVIGTGTGALPVMEDVKREARHRHVELVILPTAEAIARLEEHPRSANAILHLTC
ncbi:MTH938/NDUFAF3 family protein [Cupriavidus sp. D39]|uniref:MTH938/NDUFAF3 family protein n=1 Tax=Cupriavidus sp. D39 TaxID=2997877 RepID=UPI00226D6D44|nr:MTH938/NDUFAF3 family protein [Cupriavidus sp. D39]MCY0854570.1 MTH938/NDUFAF3 family protein [Cupriavidus sp. D39]